MIAREMEPGAPINRARCIALYATLMLVAWAALGPNAAGSSATTPVGEVACRHFGAGSPCAPPANIELECGYAFGSCESAKHMHCKLSAEQGHWEPYPLPEGLVGQRLVDSHKTVVCSGSAKIVGVFEESSGQHFVPRVWRRLSLSNAHNIKVVLREGEERALDDRLLFLFARG